MTLLPGDIRCLQGCIVGSPIFPDPLRHDFAPRKQLAVPEAKQVVACRPCGSPVSFHKRVNPIEPPEGMGGKQRGMISQFPVLMDQREEPIHQIRDFFEVRRAVIAHINRIFTVSDHQIAICSQQRRNSRPRACIYRMIQCPSQNQFRCSSIVNRTAARGSALGSLQKARDYLFLGLTQGSRDRLPIGLVKFAATA